MTSSVLTSPSFYLLFLIRLLLMVVMAAFLAHWKVVPLNFSCKSSLGSSSILSFSDSTVYKRNWRQTDIHGGWSQRGHEFFIKVFKSFIFHSENWSPGTRKICFAKISIISLCSDFLVACCSTWSPSPSSWRPSPSPWPWSWPASTSSPPSQFSSPWFTASLCCQFFLRKLFDRDLKGDFCFDHFYPLKLNP